MRQVGRSQQVGKGVVLNHMLMEEHTRAPWPSEGPHPGNPEGLGSRAGGASEEPTAAPGVCGPWAVALVADAGQLLPAGSAWKLAEGHRYPERPASRLWLSAASLRLKIGFRLRNVKTASGQSPAPCWDGPPGMSGAGGNVWPAGLSPMAHARRRPGDTLEAVPVCQWWGGTGGLLPSGTRSWLPGSPGVRAGRGAHGCCRPWVPRDAGCLQCPRNRGSARPICQAPGVPFLPRDGRDRVGPWPHPSGPARRSEQAAAPRFMEADVGGMSFQCD